MTITATRPAAKVANEKRLHPRFAVALTLDIQARGQAIARCRGTISDLSLGGMTFKTDAELEEGMCLYLKLDTSLEIRGEVRHMQEAESGGLRRYGVRFHKIGFGEAEAAKPQTFVSAHIDAQRSI
jgi:c-di-GMP-binding flagellar brake protein YcgR